MKILQINKFFYQKGGSERYFFELRKLLTAHGHQVMDFSMVHPKNEPSDYSQYFVSHLDFDQPRSGLEKIKMVGRVIYSWEAKRKLRELIKKEKPDIAHLHNISHQLSPSILSVLKKNKIPVIQTLHDYKLICPNYRLFVKGKICERCWKHKYYQTVLHRCIKNSRLRSLIASLEAYLHWFLKSYQKVDLFIAPSAFIRDKSVEFGVLLKKIKYLPHFLNSEEYQPSGFMANYLVYFGRLSKEKGLGTLLRAVAELNKDIYLKIIGEGLEQENIEILINKLGLKNTELLGHKIGEELKELIKNSLAVIVPSLWYENAPFSIYEAMFLAKPVIGSRLGGIPELIKDGETGWLFNAGDYKDLAQKINILTANPGLAIELGQKARREAQEKFNEEKHYQNLLKIYQELIEKNENS